MRYSLSLIIRCGLCLVGMAFFAHGAYGDQDVGGTASSQLISNQLVKIDEWLEAAKQNVRALSQIKASVEKYQHLQARYMQNPDNNEALYQMIKEAHSLLEAIKTMQLTPLFDAAFISELTVVSKPVAKLGIPKP
jgi:hypothetical protein